MNGVSRARASGMPRARLSGMPRPRLFRKILVPYDFSASAHAALATAIGLAQRNGGTLLVMHVISPVVPPHGAPLLPSVADREAAAEQLARVVARAVGRRKLARVRTWVMVGSPAGCILQAAAKADAIVMGTLGRTGLEHLLIGSVAERVVRHATIPVLTVRRRPRR